MWLIALCRCGETPHACRSWESVGRCCNVRGSVNASSTPSLAVSLWRFPPPQPEFQWGNPAAKDELKDLVRSSVMGAVKSSVLTSLSEVVQEFLTM